MNGVRVLFGLGRISELGSAARQSEAGRALLVTDRGVSAAGHLKLARDSLRASAVEVRVFDEVEENPTTRHVADGCAAAADFAPDLIVAIGGGSVMDCAKAINLLTTNGGEMEDYRGAHRATVEPLLPAIGVPTTAGTGSDAQSYAIICREEDGRKMACGHEEALFRTVILDPGLVATCPARVAAASGLDAVAHAVESHVSAASNPISRLYSQAAWRLLSDHLEDGLAGDPDAAGKTLLASHLAGAAIEMSMLGAAHGLVNPLTAELGVTHGVGLAILLPHVIRFNRESVDKGYRELASTAGLQGEDPVEALVQRIEALRAAGNLPGRLRDLGVERGQLAGLAVEAATEWTTGNNPRTTTVEELAKIYELAW